MTDSRRIFHMVAQYVLIAFGALVLGYTLGRLEALHARLHRLEGVRPGIHDLNKPKKWLTQTQAEANQPIAIDTRKYVTEVSTAGMEKPADLALGEKVTVQDDIQAAASRLAQLKRS